MVLMYKSFSDHMSREHSYLAKCTYYMVSTPGLTTRSQCADRKRHSNASKHRISLLKYAPLIDLDLIYRQQQNPQRVDFSVSSPSPASISPVAAHLCTRVARFQFVKLLLVAFSETRPDNKRNGRLALRKSLSAFISFTRRT